MEPDIKGMGEEVWARFQELLAEDMYDAENFVLAIQDDGYDPKAVEKMFEDIEKEKERFRRQEELKREDADTSERMQGK